jgi:arylsulfatase A-like enzyme
MYKKILISLFLTFFLNIYPWCISSAQSKFPHGIILISLDTLRADHLGIYGYHRNTSPSIDAFARESIVFERAVVQAPWTLPSHMSIMTSLYPSFHGVFSKNNHLADEHVTLAELLREGGYQTAAFADGAVMNEIFGFNQGFDIYDSDSMIGIARILPKVKKWIDENKSKPFFLFIHCYDIHAPYDPPPPYDNIFHDFTYSGHLFPNPKTLVAATNNWLKVNDEDLRHIVAHYDGGIRYTDAKIGEFLSYLQETGLKDQTLIIITSDHGEEFREHGGFLHWKLYFKPNLHVPLIMRIPNYPKEEVRINELVQSIDILPTILDIAGFPPHKRAQGRSLLPLIKRYKNIFNRSLWRIFHPFRKKEIISFSESTEHPFFPWYKDDISVMTDVYQMIYNTRTHSTQLFNHRADPLEKNNIARVNKEVTEHLLSQYRELDSITPNHKTLPITLDEQTREQLKALGYIGDTEKNPVCLGDLDCDGVPDSNDRCPQIPNGSDLGTCIDCNTGNIGGTCKKSEDCETGNICSMNQENVCDDDLDGDGILNSEDNCPCITNPNQENTYPPGGNHCGDACDCIGNLDKDG